MPVPRASDETLFQGPIALERALFCLDYEVLFTELPCCPSCSGGAVWPLATWLSPAEPRLIVESRPVRYPPLSDDEAADARAVA
jgi:hypothetical protein